jgi:hypothetical protein
VRFLIDFAQTFYSDVGIDLGGTQIFVSQQFLNTAQVGSGIQQMGGKRVPQLMGCEIRRQSGGNEIVFQVPLK